MAQEFKPEATLRDVFTESLKKIEKNNRKFEKKDLVLKMPFKMV